MAREEIRDNVLELQSNNILVELPTGVGKSKIALDFINSKNLNGNILIVVPRLVLINNWKEEFEKWNYSKYLPQVTFTTYISFPKHLDLDYDLVLFDECHHLSERVREFVTYLKTKYCILLSATVKKTLKREFKSLWPNLQIYNIGVRKAIEENILPDPKVFLIPLTLDNTNITESFIINPKAKGLLCTISFNQRFLAKRNKTIKFNCICTQAEYYQELSAMTEFYKKRYMATNNQIMYFRWQQKAGERLRWLASLKNEYVKQILKHLKNKRTLTFCNSIAQTEDLGKYCINSSNKDSNEYLQMFNDKKIKHITTCNILNEGVNLTECQYGIFVSINSSEIMQKQKLGRILRHKEPVIIILYYKNTREEEIVKDMLENYNPDLIAIVDNANKL